MRKKVLLFRDLSNEKPREVKDSLISVAKGSSIVHIIKLKSKYKARMVLALILIIHP